MARFPLFAAAAAAMFLATPAAAQTDTTPYRMLRDGEQAVLLVSTEVTGPQSLRRLTEIAVPVDPRGSMTIIEVVYTFDCPKGTLAMGEIWAYAGAELLNHGTDGEPMYTPPAESAAADMVTYACTGKLDQDPTVIVGRDAAYAAAREMIDAR